MSSSNDNSSAQRRPSYNLILTLSDSVKISQISEEEILAKEIALDKDTVKIDKLRRKFQIAQHVRRSARKNQFKNCLYQQMSEQELQREQLMTRDLWCIHKKYITKQKETALARKTLQIQQRILAVDEILRTDVAFEDLERDFQEKLQLFDVEEKYDLISIFYR